tara:strand:- start:635 stop:820 length:186 start_codon:yes stop_codon:yes gene_type:complete
MFEQSDHIPRDLSLADIANKENSLSVGKFYKRNHDKSPEFVKIVQYADSFSSGQCRLHAPA